MKSPLILIFAVAITWATVGADYNEEAIKMADMVTTKVGQVASPQCFAQIKDLMNADILAAIYDYLADIKNGAPTLKSGRKFSLNKFIAEKLLVKNVEAIPKECIADVKKVYKKVIQQTYTKGKDYMD